MSSTSSTRQDPREGMAFVFHETWIRKVMVVLMRALMKFFMVVHDDGLENLPLNGGCILVANHLSDMDVISLQLALPRPLFFMGKAELFENPILGWFYRQFGAFPVHRGVSDQWAFRHSREILDHGLTLAMFPEGTRSKGKRLSVAKTGAARLAIEKNIPIVPVAIYGSEGLFRNFPHLTHVFIYICPPHDPDPEADPLSLTDLVMFTLASKLPIELRGVYAEIPAGFEL